MHARASYTALVLCVTSDTNTDRARSIARDDRPRCWLDLARAAVDPAVRAQVVTSAGDSPLPFDRTTRIPVPEVYAAVFISRPCEPRRRRRRQKQQQCRPVAHLLMTPPITPIVSVVILLLPS